MSQTELLAQLRKTTGKSANSRLRRVGKIPAVVYGPSGHTMLEMEEEPTRHFLEKLPGRHRLIPLKVVNSETGENKSYHVLIQEVQKHVYKRIILHLDFLELDPKNPLTIQVPLQITGESPAIRKGGTIQMVARTIPIKCMPEAIPDAIVIDVSGLDLGDTLRVQEVSLPPNMELATRQNYTVVSAIAGRIARVGTPEQEQEQEQAQEAQPETEAS